MIAIAASGLFAPLPFINTAACSFLPQSGAPPIRVELGRLSISSRQRLLVDDCMSSFVRVDWTEGRLEVRGIPGSASNGARGYTWQF
jgi:hypothetical protein